MQGRRIWIFKMKIFVGQRISKEEIDRLRKESLHLIRVLKEGAHEAYCTLCEDDSFQQTRGGWLKHALKQIDNCDVFLALIRDEEKSEGLLMEIGYCLAKNKKIILAINKNVENTYLREIADEIIEYENLEDLCNKLRKLI